METEPKYQKNISLDKYTTYKIGGPAKRFYNPKSFDEINDIINYLVGKREKFFILGGGSNLLISDNGIEFPIIKIGECCQNIEIMDDCIECGAGVPLSALVEFTIDQGLKGLERLAGIPGTVGGALVMNAGAYGSDISHTVTEVTIFDENAKIIELSKEEIRFAYRSAPGLIGKVILRARFLLEEAQSDSLRSVAEQTIETRKSKHPWNYPSAGSVFKRHPLGPAGLLIDKAGMKGMKIGDAQISEKHANFIINLGSAKAVEVLELIRLIQKTIFKKFRTELELEQRLAGFTDEELITPENIL